MSEPLSLSDMHSVDSRPIVGVDQGQIDLNKVRQHLHEAHARGRYEGNDDLQAFLLSHGCLAQHQGELFPTLAGLLCFGTLPQTVLPRAVVDLGHYRGVEAISYDVLHLEKDIGGTIMDQLNRVERYIWNNTHHGMTLATGFQRLEVHEYPRSVIRELVVNMLVHRDYTNFHAAARIFLFRNRIDWISPGGLPAGLTVDNLIGAQHARNPNILKILYQAGYVEAIGQGLRTVVSELRNANMMQPEFEDVGVAFRVSVYAKQIDIDAGIGPFEQLNMAQRRILASLRMRDKMGTREIYDLFGDRGERSVQRDLRFLTNIKLITAQGYGKSKVYMLSEYGMMRKPFPELRD